MDKSSPLWFHIQLQNKCHESFADIRVSFKSTGRERFFHPGEENRVFREEGTLEATSWTLRLLCSLPRGGSCLPVIYFSLSVLPDGRVGEGCWMRTSLYTCHVWLLVGFSLCLFFSCLFNVHFFPPAFRTQWHTYQFSQGTMPEKCGEKEPWAEMAKLWQTNARCCVIVFSFLKMSHTYQSRKKDRWPLKTFSTSLTQRCPGVIFFKCVSTLDA